MSARIRRQPLPCSLPYLQLTFPHRYSYALFVPTIIADLGYKNTTAQLLSVPPYFVACIFCISAGWLADKWKQRGIFMIFFMCLA